MYTFDFLKTLQETRRIVELVVEQQAAAAKVAVELFDREIQAQASAAKAAVELFDREIQARASAAKVAVEGFNREIQAQVAAIGSGLRVQLDQFREYADLVPQIVERTTAYLRELPEDAARAQDYCSANSWLLPHDVILHESVTICGHLDEGTPQHIEEHLIQVARARLPAIAQKCQVNFPDRTRLLQQGFDAHQQKMFAASIPLFLSQADGMHDEIFDASLFRNPGPKRVRSLLDTRLSKRAPGLWLDLMRLMFRQLTSMTRLTDAGSPPSDGDVLNRHLVLHGHDLAFDTEKNSLRCLLLLELVCDCHQLLYGDPQQ